MPNKNESVERVPLTAAEKRTEKAETVLFEALTAYMHACHEEYLRAKKPSQSEADEDDDFSAEDQARQLAIRQMLYFAIHQTTTMLIVDSVHNDVDFDDDEERTELMRVVRLMLTQAGDRIETELDEMIRVVAKIAMENEDT